MMTALRRTASAALAFLLLTWASLWTQAWAEAPDGVYFPETFTLANGMQVVVVTNRRVPVVTQMVWFKVGAADDPYGHSGLAHFLEHLMFKGTDKIAPGAFSKIVAKNGGVDNAFTSYDYTVFHQSVARDRLELVMQMEADRMTGLKLTDAVVYPERDVIIEERRQRIENDPADRLGEEFNAALFFRHPYRNPVLGWAPEMSSLTREEAEAFYHRWYAPNNAILVMVGDISADELKPLAERYYGVIPPHEVPVRARPVEPVVQSARRVVLSSSDVAQALLRRSWIAPSYKTAKDDTPYALEVLDAILSGGSDSRLYRALVVDRKIATSASVFYNPLALDQTQITVGAVPAPGVDPSETEKALNEELAKLIRDGVSDEELATAKKRLLTDAAYGRDSLSDAGQDLGAALATGGTVDLVEHWPRRIDAVTRDEVNDAARRVLGNADTVTGLLLPADKEN